MKYSIVIILSSLLGFAACNKENVPENVGVVEMSGCLSTTKSNQPCPPCLTVEVINDSYFQFSHNGSEASCESELITIDYRISNDSILIVEKDEGPYAYCYCPRNISYVLGPFPIRDYIIQVIESSSAYQRDTFNINYQQSMPIQETQCKE